MAKTMLELRGVTREFTQGSETIYALRETDFSVKAGEFVAVIGPSGSGKSTFLTIAGGLRNPTRGTVAVNGVDITDLSKKQLSAIRLK
ncbi:hemin ABC transporter ATP-binding protein, partial [Candidatus Saccharibacteria bacterium 32-50-10]